jgi:hypothetical protein
MLCPKRSNSKGANIRTVKHVLIWVSTTGEIEACPPKTPPLKIFFPRAAAAPQPNVARAIKK